MRLPATTQIIIPCFCTLLTKRLATHTFTPHLQHQMPELGVMFRRLKHIKLATELQQHFIPLIQQELNVDVLCDRLEICMKFAAQNTMPQACARNCAHSRKHQPWFDSSCREALGFKEAVYKNSHSTAAEKIVAEKNFRSVTDRVKETWTQKRNVELCELSARYPSQFWKAFKAPQGNVCPVELSAQFEAFRGLMGAEPTVGSPETGRLRCIYILP